MTKLFKDRKDIIPFIIMVIVIIGGLVRVFTYSSGIHSYDSYDFLEDIVWAEETLKSGKPLSNNFIYYYTIPFGGNYLVAPFVYLLGPCLLANELGMFVYYLIYLVLIYKLATLFFKDHRKYYFVAISTIFVFTYVGDNLLHHVLSYGIGYICLLGQLISVIEIYRNNHKLFYYFVLTLFVLLAASNGISTIGLSTVPILLSLIILSIKNRKEIDRICLLNILLSSVLGLVINKIANNGVLSESLDILRMGFTTNSNIANNLLNNLIKSYLDLFNTYNGTPDFLSLAGVVVGVSMLFAFIFLVFSIYAIVKFAKTNGNNEQFFVYLSCVGIMIVSFCMFVLTKANSERFLFNLILSSLIIASLFYCGDNYANILQRIKIVFLLFVIILLIQETSIVLKENRKNYISEKEFVNFLLENDLVYGYMPYMAGRNVYVLSDGRIKIAYLDNTDKYNWCIEYGYNSLENYSKPKDTDKFFIVLEDEYYSEFVKKDIYAERKSELYDNHGHILIYDIDYWDFIFE